MTENERALLVLNRVISSPGRWLRALKERTLTAADLWRDRSSAQALGLKDETWERAASLLGSPWPEDEILRAQEAQARIVFQGDESYPGALLDLEDPPVVLYVRGSWPLSSLAVALVGTRRCSPYGVQVAGALGRKLAEAGVVVISGGAVGIDGAAHSGAIEGSGVTAAILGTGVDQVYPRSHEDLFWSILDSGGALISRFPMGVAGTPWHFPKRNGMIAALARHVVVVESPLRGGAIITARAAAEMGRDVWAVPGQVGQTVSVGSNKLLFDGAQPLWDLDQFVSIFAETSRSEQLDLRVDKQISESPLLEELRRSGALTVDQLAQNLGVAVHEVTGILAELEGDGLAYRSGPGRWSATP
ncbi:MAG: DNA-protecting protein DprA [Dethiosulfovibrio peptidovorans]|nr:MAG: DNA-protecting protein DprA [Dethiosulfovibrio peptidovorans]